MIKERTQWQGRRLDNGEMVIGSLLDNWEWFGCYQIEVCNEEVTGNCYYKFEIDPTTLEPVAAKPIKGNTLVGEYSCSNCNAAFIEGMGFTPYCGNCGQRLEWQV